MKKHIDEKDEPFIYSPAYLCGKLVEKNEG